MWIQVLLATVMTVSFLGSIAEKERIAAMRHTMVTIAAIVGLVILCALT